MKKLIICGFLIGFAPVVGCAKKSDGGKADDPKNRKGHKQVAAGGTYSVSWLGNTFPDLENYVGNAARSMWVSPEGVVYTASEWDEKSRNIGIYQNGHTIGAMGGTKDSQGSAIGGDSTYIYTAQQRSGYIGRYNRNTGKRDLLFKASNGTGDAIRGILVNDHEIFVSDYAGSRIGVYSNTGTLLREWEVKKPGAITMDAQSNLWMAEMDAGRVKRYSADGKPGPVIQLAKSSRPSALYCDKSAGVLYIGDEGPDQNIKIYTDLSAVPRLKSTFGVPGGFLNTSTAVRGTAGDKRFTRVVGIGKDRAGNIYVLNNPWGGSWDMGRNGATDVHCYSPAGNLLWTLQALNFEGNAAADPGSGGIEFYSGNILYSLNRNGTAHYKANTIDPFRYPDDPRIDINNPSRGLHFAHLANIGGHRILVTCSQNPDDVYSFYFNERTDGYVAIPGEVFKNPHIRSGFCLDSLGGLWMGVWLPDQRKTVIRYYPLEKFGPMGKPVWGRAHDYDVPSSIERLNRLEYVASEDRLILAGGNNDWTLMGNRIEVYNSWKAGNRTPNTVITLSRGQAKSMTAAGNYVFVGYYAIPNIDIFDMTTGKFVLSMTPNNNVYVGNDVDSMYGIKAYRKPDGQYLITKDDYNANKIVLYQWTPQ